VTRRLIVSEFLTLDGVMEDSTPWQAGYGTAAEGAFKRVELFNAEALLLGRVTYDGFAAYWPAAHHTGDFGERMNTLPKYVATHRPLPLGWGNSHALQGEAVAAIRALKGTPGGEILTYGSATLVQTLLRHRLIDELRLLMYPLVLGQGKRLFAEGDRHPLELVSLREMGKGVLLLIYRSAP
jgi:dihydrofolate reductase